MKIMGPLNLLIGKIYGILSVALRYFNVYGSRQALSNPYTGCVATFATRILNDKPPYIFEDGDQMRDFVQVKDVARANLLALKHNSATYMAINIGTGKPISIRKLAQTLIEVYNKPHLKPYVSGEYHRGDIRHCYAEIKRAHELLEYEPTIDLEEG